MRYAALKYNDIVDCENGICVSYWCQGCPIHCKGCHNQETWDFNGGQEIDRDELVSKIIAALRENGIARSFSVLGGEPLAAQNLNNTIYIVEKVRNTYPNIKIYLWTGYVLENFNEEQKTILPLIDILINGPYLEEKRDITLKLRGSTNQRITKRGVLTNNV